MKRESTSSSKREDGARSSARAGALPAAALLLAVAAAFAAFGRWAPPREAVPAWLAVYALGAALLAGAGALLVRARVRRMGAWVVAGAVALRLATLAAPVSLSDDVHRYLWDGSLLASGRDPYASRPVDVVGAAPGAGPSELTRLNSPRYYTVYPPLAQAVFAAAAVAERLGADGALSLRAIFAAFDLGAVLALLWLLDRMKRPRAWALLYAWNPLAVWELAGSGHTEALMLPWLLLALGAAMADRPARAGLFVGLAASAKLTALVVAPVLLAHLARRLGAKKAARLGVAALVLAAGFGPFASPTLAAHLGESLALYQRTLSFNAWVYYPVRYLVGYREGWTGTRDYLAMPLLTVLTVAALCWLARLVWRQRGAVDGSVRDPSRRAAVALAHAAAWSLATHLLLSRVIHPWYLLPALALGALTASRPLLLLSLLLPLSYLRYHPLGYEAWWVLAAQAAPFALAVGLELRAARMRRRRHGGRRRSAAAAGSEERPRALAEFDSRPPTG